MLGAVGHMKADIKIETMDGNEKFFFARMGDRLGLDLDDAPLLQAEVSAIWLHSYECRNIRGLQWKTIHQTGRRGIGCRTERGTCFALCRVSPTAARTAAEWTVHGITVYDAHHPLQHHNPESNRA
jgi:hypothetical protein